MNNISISTCFDYEIPLREQLRYAAQIGFTHISLGSNLEHSRLFEIGRVPHKFSSIITPPISTPDPNLL